MAAVDNYIHTPSFRTATFCKPTLPTALAAFATIEFLIVTIALLLTDHGFSGLQEPSNETRDLHLSVTIAIAALAFLNTCTLNNFRYLQSRSLSRFICSGISSIARSFLAIASVLYFLSLSIIYPPNLLSMQFLAACAAVVAIRYTVDLHFKRAMAAGNLRGRRIVLVGRQKNFAWHVARFKSSCCAAQILFCPIPPTPASAEACKTADSLAVALVEECRALRADDIVLLTDETRENELKKISSTFLDIPAAVYAIPTRHLQLWANSQLSSVSGVPALSVAVPRMSDASRLIKRTIDIVSASLGLLLLSPLLLFVGIAVRLDSQGPIFFTQIRHGYNNQVIHVLKFRTMHASGDAVFRQASTNDPRITRVGRILRRSGIDEIPQLLNVLRGNMSIVGPRPHAVPHNQMFTSKIDHFSRRHNVLPGITGWAQVNGYRGETDTLEKMCRRIECDLFYVDNWSLLLDLKIVLLTLFSKRTYINAG